MQTTNLIQMERRILKALANGPVTGWTEFLAAYIRAGGSCTGRYSRRDVIDCRDGLVVRGFIEVSNDKRGEVIYTLAR